MTLERAEAQSAPKVEASNWTQNFASELYAWKPVTGDVPAPAFAGDSWAQFKPVFDAAKSVQFSSAAENAAANVVPDFILGADGVLHANPNKTEPSADGKINIQVEGDAGADSVAEAKKVANENQKKAIREMIDYFQKNNPGAQVPQHWLDQLAVQPDDVPAPRQRSEAPNPVPQQRQEAPSAPAPAYRGGGGGAGGGGGGGGGFRGGYGNYEGAGMSRDTSVPRRHVELPPPIAGDMKIDGPPTITPEKIDEILKQYNSPAQGLGKYIHDKGVEAGINPAVALAFFIQESSAGTAGVARETKSWGNIKGEGPAGSVRGFRAYQTYEQGVDDWYRLIKEKYLAPPSEGGFGCQTLSQIISKYAPASDNNNERAYVANVKGMVEGWKA